MFRSKMPTNRRPLTRAEAARVVAAPLPNRTSERRSSIAGHASGEIAIALALACVVMAWLIGWLVACDLIEKSREDFSLNLQKAIEPSQFRHNGGG